MASNERKASRTVGSGKASRSGGTISVRGCKFDPKAFFVATLADALAIASRSVPFARVEIGIRNSKPRLNPSDETISGVTLGRFVVWECSHPFRLTFALPPDKGDGTVKFEGVKEKDEKYRRAIAFKNHEDADGTGQVEISYEIQVLIKDKWVGKDPSVIIDTTAARFYVLLPRSEEFEPSCKPRTVSREASAKNKSGRGK